MALAAAADRSEEHVLSLNDILAIGGALGCEGIHTDPSYASRMASTFATFDFDGGGMYSVAKARAHAAATILQFWSREQNGSKAGRKGPNRTDTQ